MVPSEVKLNSEGILEGEKATRMNQETVPIVYVVPIGPSCQIEFVRDTLESIRHYATVPFRIVCLCHESNSQTALSAADGFDGAEVLTHSFVDGHGGRLYYNLSFAYGYVLDRYDFQALIRVDTDALITGDGLDSYVLDYFECHPEVGLAGRLDFAIPGVHHHPVQYITGYSSLRNFVMAPRKPAAMIKKPALFFKLRKALAMARANGYKLAEYVNGASYAWRRDCLAAVRANGHFKEPAFVWTNFEEDHLFGILVRAANYELGDMMSGDLPFAIAHRELPDHPDSLLKSKKKLVHSVKRFDGLNESEIREKFRQARIGSA